MVRVKDITKDEFYKEIKDYYFSRVGSDIIYDYLINLDNNAEFDVQEIKNNFEEHHKENLLKELDFFELSELLERYACYNEFLDLNVFELLEFSSQYKEIWIEEFGNNGIVNVLSLRSVLYEFAEILESQEIRISPNICNILDLDEIYVLKRYYYKEELIKLLFELDVTFEDIFYVQEVDKKIIGVDGNLVVVRK